MSFQRSNIRRSPIGTDQLFPPLVLKLTPFIYVVTLLHRSTATTATHLTSPSFQTATTGIVATASVLTQNRRKERVLTGR